jgi:hypothetical protein
MKPEWMPENKDLCQFCDNEDCSGCGDSKYKQGSHDTANSEECEVKG